MASNELKMIVDYLWSNPVAAKGSIEQRRSEFQTALAQFQPAADVICQAVDAGGVPAEWITAPGAEQEKVIYYLHGGGYTMGSIATHREVVSRLSRAAGARALLIDYRLAPENRFPAALEDAKAGYRWLLSTGVKPSQLVVAGESAGGGLTVATLMTLRDSHLPLPAAGICMSPWVDMECLGKSMVTNSSVDPNVRQEDLKMNAEAYLGEADRRTPLAAPIYGNLKGLPPLLIQVGTAEILFDDATRLAERARLDSVDVVFEPWEEMIHMWHVFPMLPEGNQAIERIAEFMRNHGV
jgi:monoterpene epsilon-lactone hydrolase